MMGRTTMRYRRRLLKSNGMTISVVRGFTLIELMVTIAVMAILLAVAIPSFNDVLLGNKLTAHANNLVASTFIARSEAIKRNVAVTLCASSDGANCATSGGWEQGWIVACKTTDNASCDSIGPGWIVLQRQQAASSGLKISESGANLSLSFSPTAVGTTQAALTVCRATPTVGGQERVVDISATGRATVRKTSNAACS